MDPTTSGVAVVVLDAADAEFYVGQIRQCYNLKSTQNSASIVGCRFASNPIDIEENIIKYGMPSIDS